jgi:type IV pilus biogenesis protein CpaD/CtpE
MDRNRIRLGYVTAAALALAGCTTTPPAPPPAVPATLLAPHYEPAMPTTNEELLIYAVECRQELRLCNAHKDSIRNLLRLDP